MSHFALDAMCDHLQAVTFGSIDKLIINVPPGMAKSTIVAVIWPVWEWTFRPEVQWLFATHSQDLTYRDAKRRRDLIASEWYQSEFSGRFAVLEEAVEYVKNNKQGFFYSSSTEARITGWRGSRLVLDDPQDPRGAESEIKRASTIEWLTRTWPTRINLNSPHRGQVLIQQRLHEQDATGLYMAEGNWTLLKIPLEYTGAKNPTPIYSDPREIIGTGISDAIYPPDDVKKLKRTLGPYGVAGQLQQEPAPAEGGLIKRAWIRHYEEKGDRLDVGDYQIDPMNCVRFSTVDPAMTEKDLKDQNDPDYTVMAAWALFQATRGTLLLLLDLIRDRMEGPEIVAKLKAFHARWQFAVIGVENVSEKMLFQTMKREGLPIRDISKRLDAIYTISGDKKARALAATPLMGDGRFYVPTYAPWLGDFIRELTLFPNAAHDDCVDCVSYGCLLAGKVSGYMAETPSQEPKTVLSHDERPADRDDKPDSLSGWRSTPSPGFRYGR